MADAFGQYGANPSGATATLERRLEVLELAREHDFFILEGEHLVLTSNEMVDGNT